VTPTGERRRGASQPHRDGAHEHGHHAAQVHDAQALAALRTLAAWLGIGAATTAAVFTQHALPPDVASADAYLRLHRAQVKAGTPGWSRAGAVRSVTTDAWRIYVDEQTTRARRKATTTAPVAANDADDELDAALGIRTRRAAR
jgi:hypothetical protein